MKHRKIWSIPIAALALVLMLAGALVVTSIVQAQAASVKPRVANAVEDFELQVDAGDVGDDLTIKVINLADSDGDDPVFTDTMDAATDGDDPVDDPLAFTVMTSNGNRAITALSVGVFPDYSPGAAPPTGPVAGWWDGLSEAQRLAVVGEVRDSDSTDDNECDSAFCGGEDVIAEYDDQPVGQQTIITQAFHWNMLSGAEMIAAARAGGLSNPSSYASGFADLSGPTDDDEDTAVVETDIGHRARVQTLYTVDNPSEAVVLRRGMGTTLTVTSGDGTIDAVGASDADGNDIGDLRADNVGAATITVKASDSTGRLIPPGDGSDTVGDVFEVDVIYQPLDDIGAITLLPADGTVRVDGIGSDGVITIEAADIVKRRITISDNAEDKVSGITVLITRAVYEQLINYSLVDGSSLTYNIDGGNGTTSAADINVKAGATPIDASFTIVVNEEGVSANRTTMDVEVVVASGNKAPAFDDAALDALDTDVTIREHMGDGEAADLITSGLPIDFGAHASDSDNQVLSYSLSPANSGLDIDEDSGEVTADPGKDLLYVDDEDADNTTEFTVTVSDGTLSDSYTFDMAVTTNNAKADVSRDDVEFVEADEDVEGSVNTYVVTLEPDEVRIDQRGVVIGDVADYITQAVDPSSLTYAMVTPTSPLRLGTGTESGKIVMDYVPSPAPGEETLEYAIVVTIDDGYDSASNGQDEDDNDLPDLTLMINISITVEPLPDQAFPVAEVNIDENEIGIVLPSDHAALVGLIGDEAVEVTHAGGTGAGVTGSGNFSVDGATGEVTLLLPQDFEVDGANHTVTLRVERTRDSILLGTVTVLIQINDVNEAPAFASDAASTAWVAEDAQDTHAVMTSDLQEAVAFVVTAVDEDGDTLNYSVLGSDGSAVPFAISSGGALTVSGNNALDHEVTPSYDVVITANDGVLDGTLNVTITIGNSNEAPYFVNPTLEIDVDEDVAVGDAIETYVAADPDDIVLEFTLKNQDDTEHFSLGLLTGELAIAKGLDYETQQVHLVEINVTDTSEASAEIQLTVNVTDVNDNRPAWNGPLQPRQSTPENTARGVVLGNYGATDADRDGADTVTYSLGGDDSKSFWIFNPGDDIDGDGAADDDQYTAGDLMTLESLDTDSATPCSPCNITVIAADPNTTDWPRKGANLADTSQPVVITILGEEDSISTPHITKANPVPGVGMGLRGTALSGTKVKSGVPGAPEERPSDIPAISYTKVEGKNKVTVYPASPVNFVETDWANWGTVLRIEVTAESPDATCGVDVGGNNNQCVELIVKSDSADDVIHLAAYRSGTQENRYVAAVMLVELEAHASNYVLNSGGDEVRTPIYKHQRVRNVVPSAAKTDPALQVPRLQVDEEDEIEIEFHNLRTDIDVENEPPEISNLAPEHETAFDDSDVDYTFSVTDDNSGLPEPEDLPDADGDEDYTPVVGLVSDTQCVIDDPDDGVLARAIHIHESEYLDCGDNAQDGEYIANEGGWGFAPIRDDKDFDETSDGFDVKTTLVLAENEIFYVTFIACDRAGNCASYDPDGNDNDAELAKITIDTELPKFVEARTGVKWDSSDNEYDDDRSFIQVIFDDLTPLNEETVETDDFVVQGHTIKAVYVYSPDDEDTLWGDENSDGTLNEDTKPTRYANGGPNSESGGGALYRKIDRTVFLELEDELLADETPDVTIIPNGVEDQAGNEQDDGDVEAKDWIAPRFIVVSIVAADTPEGASNQLAGDGDEVTVMVTSDERLDQTRPEVTVTYVDASMVDTKGTATCGTDGKRKRGEITMNTAGKTSTDCADIQLATGDDLNNHIEKITNTEWVVTVTEPKATGYYNFHITGADRSPKKNEGSEGVSAKGIVTDFFDSDGDVNTDDAVFWEADINLPNPNIRVSGVAVTDNEASVEFRSPLFVEIDFTADHWALVDCDDVETDDRMANCMNENSEYSEDNFDDVVVTMFQLDGVDMTDSVKTTDSQTFLVSLESVSIGDHTVLIQGMDQAGNILEDTLEIDFEVNDRDPFEKRLSPGWNLVSLPGEPANSSIASVFGSDVEVRTVYTYDPVIPGGWMVAVRETLESDWQGDLTEISGQRGYWVLSDAIQDWEVSIPRLAGGAAGTGTPIQPPVIALYAGWNLIPVIDISGDGEGGNEIDAEVYLQKLGDGLDLARVLGFNTIRNQWQTVLDPDMQMNNTLEIGSAYWIFVREAASLVPSGFVGGGGGGD